MLSRKIGRVIMSFACKSHRALLLIASLPFFALPVSAQTAAPEEDEELGSRTIVVTGSIRQGGAQDIAHFRSISFEEIVQSGLPQSTSLTMEGLLGEHDLTLPSERACDQLFCVATQVMDAQLPSRAEDTHFLGIGFASGVDAQVYRSEPLSLIAVVDRSGSMGGIPIARVKEGLHAVVNNMREGDRLGIVIYGSSTVVHQPVIDLQGNKDALHAAIDSIVINGSTYMEAGLRLGYETALAELENSNGRTRLMLFTDENANVGDTSPNGFMGQAIAGSRQGIGLTTIGVGRHFDAALATQISSVRGGNLFFVPQAGSGKELFEAEFENMVSEVAHDIAISIDPAEGMRVSGVYGVPGEMITDAGNGTLTVTIGSAFLSSNGGGIFATLEGDAAQDMPVADVSVAYTDAISQRREYDQQSVQPQSGQPHENLAKAQLLVGQYFGITDGLAAYHENKDAEAAANMFAAVSESIESSGLEGMEEELNLVNGLRDGALHLAGLDGGKTLPFEVFGEWRVVRVSRVDDMSRGDLIEITDDGEFITERARGRDAGDYIYQDFAINERQLHIEGTELVLEYSVRGNRLRLRDRFDGVNILLERI